MLFARQKVASYRQENPHKAQNNECFSTGVNTRGALKSLLRVKLKRQWFAASKHNSDCCSSDTVVLNYGPQQCYAKDFFITSHSVPSPSGSSQHRFFCLLCAARKSRDQNLCLSAAFAVRKSCFTTNALPLMFSPTRTPYVRWHLVAQGLIICTLA